MKRKDYMVSTDYKEPEIVYTLKEARQLAKQWSKQYGVACIDRWIAPDYSDYQEKEIDDYWGIIYENGKDVTKQYEERFQETVKRVRL